MKKSFTKLLSVLCTIVMCVLLMASSYANAETKTKLALALWDEKQRAYTQELIDTYTKQHPEVEIEIQLTPYKGGEYWTKLEASATGGKAPDVFWYNVLHADSYIEGGIVADLTEAIKKSDINDSFPKNLIDNYVRDGKNYAVPKDFDTNALWYNKEMFDKAGVAYPTDDMT